MFELSHELIVFIVAATPFFELHSAMPLALAYYNMHWIKAFSLSLSGNIFPILPFLLLLKSLAKYLKKLGFFSKLFEWIQEHTKEKSNLTEKYEMLGLMIFVAVPLPFTGAWFGSLIAFVLGIRLKYGFFAMLLGLILSGIIILCVIQFSYLKAVIIGAALIGTATTVLFKFMIKNQ